MNCPVFLKLGWLVMTAQTAEIPGVMTPPLQPDLTVETSTGSSLPSGSVVLMLDTPTGATAASGFGRVELGNYYTCSVQYLRDCGPSAFVLDVNPHPGTSGAFIRHPKVFYYPDFDPGFFVWPGVLAPGRAPSSTPGQRSQLVLAGTSLLDLATGVSAPGRILPDAPGGNPEPDPYLEILLSPKSYRTGSAVSLTPPGDTHVGGVQPEENMPEPATSMLALISALFLGTGRKRPSAATIFPPEPGTGRA